MVFNFQEDVSCKVGQTSQRAGLLLFFSIFLKSPDFWVFGGGRCENITLNFKQAVLIRSCVSSDSCEAALMESGRKLLKERSTCIVGYDFSVGETGLLENVVL